MNEVKKVTLTDVVSAMTERASKVRYGVRDDNPVVAVIVFDPVKSKWVHNPDGYSLESRSYRVSSGEKYWHGECGGNSLYSCCLDPNSPDSQGIRLDWYLYDWVVDYCYFESGV